MDQNIENLILPPIEQTLYNEKINNPLENTSIMTNE